MPTEAIIKNLSTNIIEKMKAINIYLDKPLMYILIYSVCNRLKVVHAYPKSIVQ